MKNTILKVIAVSIVFISLLSVKIYGKIEADKQIEASKQEMKARAIFINKECFNRLDVELIIFGKYSYINQIK